MSAGGHATRACGGIHAPINCTAFGRLFGVWAGRFFCFNGFAGDGFSIPKGHGR